MDLSFLLVKMCSLVFSGFANLGSISATADSVALFVSSSDTNKHILIAAPPFSGGTNKIFTKKVYVKQQGNSFRTTVPRFSGSVDLAYYSFAIADNSTLTVVDSVTKCVGSMTGAKVSDTTIGANHLKAVHGIYTQDFQQNSDLSSIGVVSFVTWGGFLNGLCSATHVAGYDSSISVDGVKYWCKESNLQLFNDHMSYFTSRGFKVKVQIILNADDQCASTDTSEDLLPKMLNGANIYAPILTTRKRFQKYRAVIEYLARKYAKNVQMWDVGNEINSHDVWNNSGDITPVKLIDNYEKRLRATYLAVKKYSSKAEVYTSLDHCWGTNYRYKTDPDLGSMSAKLAFDLLVKRSNLKGSFDWGVGIHVYSFEKGGIRVSPDIWNDDIYGAKNSFSSPGITFRNLGMLKRYLGSRQNLVNGAVRKIILSEQGISAQKNGIESNYADSLQGAAYWYSFQKAKSLGISGYFYQNYTTVPVEQDLSIGILRADRTPRRPISDAIRCSGPDNVSSAISNCYIGYTNPIKYYSTLGRPSITDWKFIDYENSQSLEDEELCAVTVSNY